LFWKDQVGMSVADIMVLQALFGVAVVVLEFPSGYLADRIGHRRALLIGATLSIVGWLAYTRAASFAAVAGAEMLLGAASAFVSGADRALLWTSLGEASRHGEYPRWEGRLRAASQTSEAVSAAAGGWLYTLSPRLPFWLQVPTAALGLATIVGLSESPRPHTTRSHARRALRVVGHTLWRHRRLRAAMALSVALGLASYVMVWLIQPYLQRRGVPAAWFGPIWAGAHVWLAGVSLVNARVVTVFGIRATLVGCCLLVPLGYVGLAASTSVWGAAFYLCFMTLRGLQGPILASVMQADAPDEDRASVLSLVALVFRLAFVVAGPPIGVLVDRAGLETALAVLAAFFTVIGFTALALFAHAHRIPRAAGS
jgi:MFS family permease